MVNQLPAYLQQRQSRTVTERAASGLGASMPPHISIQGNSFTLIDAAGNEQNEGGMIDVCIADISDVNCKRYMDPNKPWMPDSKDPPLCWSANGVAPSKEAAVPQNAICATCTHNERGSAVSKISGASIKACRDEKWMALILPKYPTMLFRLVLTPGSFKNWKEFLAPFEKHGVEISDYVTRMQFEPKVNGVIQFLSGIGANNTAVYIDENTYKSREAALTGKATDILVGRNDTPIQGALGTPVQQTQPVPQIPVVQPVQTPFSTQPQTLPIQETQPAQPPATRRRRNTTEAAPNGFGGQTSTAVPDQAPFMPAAAEQPNGGAAFGMAQGAEPNAALTSTLEGLFGKK